MKNQASCGIFDCGRLLFFSECLPGLHYDFLPCWKTTQISPFLWKKWDLLEIWGSRIQMQCVWLSWSVVHFLTSPEKTIESWPVLFFFCSIWMCFSCSVWLDKVFEIDFFPSSAILHYIFLLSVKMEYFTTMQMLRVQ